MCAISRPRCQLSVLKVANIIEDARIAGPQVRIVRVAAALANCVETTVVMPELDSQEFRSICQKNNISVMPIKLTRLSKRWTGILRYLFSFPTEVFSLAVALKRLNVDLVHVSGGSWQYKGVIAARLSGVPAVWHLNDSYCPSAIRGIFFFLSPLASGWIFASNATKKYYSRYIIGDKKWSIVPSAIGTPSSLEEVVRERKMSRGPYAHRTKAVAPVVGTVASVNPIKGLEDLLRAVAIAQKEITDLEVVIVGPVYESQKTYHQKLVSLADSLNVQNLRWEGYHRNVRPFLNAIDVYVCSSLAESSPNSVWEAMSCGCPIVSTDVGDVGLHVDNAQCGIVVPVEDYVSLADGITRVLCDNRLAKRLSGNAAKYAFSTFSESVVADKTLEAYRMVLGDTNYEN